jgi:pyridoxine 5-phosphate synthase
MAGLMVNVDHVATVRQARKGNEPDPVLAAALAELGGCDGIIVHLREDRRHIQDRDLEMLRETVRTRLNLEMAAVPAMVSKARQVKPEMATLVPEKRQELTTEGGLDIITHRKSVRSAVQALQQAGIRVSLFVDPDPRQVKAAKREAGAEYVEIHTGSFADAATEAGREREIARIREAAALASRLGLGVNAGHGLNYTNIKQLLGIREIEEFSIGHSIIARALMTGMQQAVRDMVAVIQSAPGNKSAEER